MRIRALTVCLAGTFFGLFLSTSAMSAVYDWGTTGVSDTSKVTNIEQITDNQYNDGAPGGDYPRYSYSAPNPWSKNGDWVVYTRNYADSDTAKEICLIKPDGTGFSRLTDNSEEDSNATFGSDGNIYFERYVSASFNYKILRMNSDGSNELNLTDAHSGAAGERDVHPSPDASKIVYRYNSRLWAANSDGTSPVQISPESPTIVYVYDGQNSWSPDSNWIAYSGYRSTTGYRIHVVQPDGSNEGEVTSLASGSDTWPAWSPDGNKIAFERYDNGVYKLMMMDPDGSNLETLDQESGNWTEIRGPLSWSPNSQWLAYVKYYNDGVGTNYFAIFIVDVATKTTYQLTTGYEDWHPYWSPAGSQVLFMDGRYDASRDDSTALGATDNMSDMLLLNLIGDYGSVAGNFPWHMFLPAIEYNGK